MSFESGFEIGAGVVGDIQNALLAKKLREIQDARYADETKYNRARDLISDEQRQKDRDEQWSKWEYDAQENQRRAAERRADEAEDRRLRQIQLAMAMGGQGTQAMTNAIQNRREDALNRARIAELGARTEAIKAGRMGGSGGYGYDEYGPDGELLKSRRPLGAGAGAPTVDGLNRLSPEDQQLANRISELQTDIGKQKVEMAGGDMYSGLFGLGGSRKGKIEAAQREIAKLQGMQRGAQAQPGMQPQQQSGGPQAQPGAQLSQQDARMLQWAQANPNDPRAAAILQRAGK